jgi:hypothetical protein
VSSTRRIIAEARSARDRKRCPGIEADLIVMGSLHPETHGLRARRLGRARPLVMVVRE